MGSFRNEHVIRWLAIFSFAFIMTDFPGCATIKIEPGTFSPRDKDYRITVPETGKGWEPIRIDKEDIALWHKQHRAMIAVISSDTEQKGLSLETLRRHLFLGITDKEIIAKEPARVNNQNALHAILEGKMDNNQLKIDSYVIKAGERVYDLVYWAPADSFDKVKDDFEGMVRSFQYIKD